MPELPEAETIKRDLKKELVGQSFAGVTVYDERTLGQYPARDFIAQTKGAVVIDVLRKGKCVIFLLEKRQKQYFLVTQLRMTGQLICTNQSPAPAIKDLKVSFQCGNGKHLHFNDQRVFGRLTIVEDLNDIPHLRSLGPEPLNSEFDLTLFASQLKRRKTPIKSLLMDQHFLAGIGNIYASEILFRAQTNPKRKAQRLKKGQAEAIFTSIRTVLNEAIRYRGVSMRNYRDAFGKKGRFFERVNVYGRAKKPCPLCQNPIKRIVQNGRSTFFCSNCQK